MDDGRRSFGLNNWWHTYERRLLFLDQAKSHFQAILQMPGGVEKHFGLDGKEILNAAGGASATLESVGTGWKIVLADSSVELYDASARLTSITTRTGRAATISYDVNGRISTVSDDFGETLAFSYTGGRLSGITNPAGGTYTYDYDGKGNLASVTYPDATVRRFHYELSNLPSRLTGITDESGGRFSNYTYDNRGRVTVSEHAGGAERYEFTYASDDLSTSIKDPAGAVRNYVMSIVGSVKRLTAITGSPCSDCGSASTTYWSVGNVEQRTDFAGNRTRYDYDADGRNLESSRTEAYGTPRARSIQTTWHPVFRIPTSITEPNRISSFTHDANGNVLTRTITDTSVTPNVSRTWTYSYNSFGKVLTEDGPRTDISDITSYTYYGCTHGSECGQVHTITNALLQTTTFGSYDANGSPTQIVAPSGLVTNVDYDLRQRISDVCEGGALPSCVGGELTHLDYWPTGLLKRVTKPDGSFIEYSYDGAHRLTEVKDNLNNKIAYTLDAMGNRKVEAAYDQSGVLRRATGRVFNELNQIWKDVEGLDSATLDPLTAPTSRTTIFGYDNNSNQTSVAAPLARNSSSIYDELNRLKQITDPASGITEFGYDANDNVTSVKDPENLTTNYTYTGFGEVKTLTSPDTGLTNYTYDSAGNLKTKTDARGAMSLVTYSYDALNRVTQAVFSDQTITYTYDSCLNGIGRLCSFTDNSGSTSYQYDAHGRITQKTQLANTIYWPMTRTIGYQYTSGNLTRITMPTGVLVDYGHDAAGRISSITVTRPGSAPVLLVSNVQYDPFGGVSGWTWSNGATVTRQTDPDGRITQITSKGTATYTYDDADRITGIAPSGGYPMRPWGFGYDGLDRLTSVNSPADGSGYVSGWTYDRNGNRLSQTGGLPATYNYSTSSGALSSNRLQTVTGYTQRDYLYDAAGNITRDGFGDCCTIPLSYDGSGRMTMIAGVPRKYNALGQRTVNGIASSLYDEVGQLLEVCEAVGPGSCGMSYLRQYIWLGDIPVGAILPH
ncbi:MAG TPA: hypothetical protein VKB34_13050, partial [Povalibacter sp.]|nr:hypothetical protein [Povalibacter sp.]